MTALDYILEGLEAELALERELGVRSFEIDRSLREPLGPTGVEAAPIVPKPAPIDPRPTPIDANRPQKAAMVFLHDRPLPPAGEEMIAKISSALGLKPEDAPILTEPPLPEAKVYIVLGAFALRKWFPERNLSPGNGFDLDSGAYALVTYSPNYILRFNSETAALKQIKRSMWTSIKAAAKRL